MSKRCTHPEVVKLEWFLHCKRCRARVGRCVDCIRCFVLATLEKNDGERCSRCFDRHQYDNKRGLFSDDSPQDVASSYGFYKKARHMKELKDEKDAEWYEYDGFVVSDSAESESDDSESNDESDDESDGGDSDSDYVPDSDESLVIE